MIQGNLPDRRLRYSRRIRHWFEVNGHASVALDEPSPAIVHMKHAKRSHPERHRGRAATPVWLRLVTIACDTHPISLSDIYALVKRNPKARGKENVEAKVRQVLYTHPDVFIEVRAGVWSMVNYFAPNEANQLRLERKQRLESRRHRTPKP